MSKKNSKLLTIELDASNLTSAQQRLIRYLNSMILNTLTTDDEAEYFESSNEAMQMLAELVKQANFTGLESTKAKKIPYSSQALEFCIEAIAEDIVSQTTNVFDN